ncbi:FAD-binding oxidoreductase, partial [Candidatus Parcubacteria bacterium]|nr:FAD-binding oxidoreductase [Candidatus Parcubacteria bacterium]
MQSPWTTQIRKERDVVSLTKDIKTDICIVGGGISGIITAYNLLKSTSFRVAVVDAHEIAHGATGHNAGQLVAELERPIYSIVEDFGLIKTMKAMEDIESSWIIIEQIIQDLDLSINYSTFLGYNLYSTKKQVQDKLKDMLILQDAGVNIRKMLVAKEFYDQLEIETEYLDLIELIDQDNMLSLSETKNTDYIAAFPLKKGCLNSALFTEKIAHVLLKKYANRFEVFEKTYIKEIDINNDDIVTKSESGSEIKSERLILCTNGFENFTIKSNTDKNLNFNFHKHIKGLVGYMFAKTEKMDKNPGAFAYYDKFFEENEAVAAEDVDRNRDVAYLDSYTYTTRRHYDLENEDPKNLFCIGGICTVLEDSSSYNKQHEYDVSAKEFYTEFIKNNIEDEP